MDVFEKLPTIRCHTPKISSNMAEILRITDQSSNELEALSISLQMPVAIAKNGYFS